MKTPFGFTEEERARFLHRSRLDKLRWQRTIQRNLKQVREGGRKALLRQGLRTALHGFFKRLEMTVALVEQFRQRPHIGSPVCLACS
ncbi:hypothetical protein Thivi_0132 [Thiocystis violascens DSM 198]|uniref:Uncharacterized protein n=1 Tax=Thiocystis violascens (strain ATCC 17096 / DSM 198 / 6111) TaxID=765911 RepID=I3Y5E0_THIV6|nr:hypothetical protein Thivi_0132 [Thiocystis violascens DSM 198]